MSVTVTATAVVVDDGLGDLETRVDALETRMTGAVSEIQALQTQFDAYRADVNAKIAALQAAVDANDPAAVQAAIDAFDTDVTAAQGEVGDANNDGIPAAPAPEPGV